VRFLIRSLSVLALSATLLAQWPASWRNWRYAAPIAITPAEAGRLANISVPSSVTTHARRGWSDLRVIDEQGQEVPFMLHARFGGRSVNQRAVPLLEPVIVAGTYRQAVADAGPNPPVHNSVKLGIETEANLLSFVEIAVSSDSRDWRVIRDRAPIYVLLKEGRGLDTDVFYPDSVSRYVRIRILDGSTKYTLASATLGYTMSDAAERVAVDAELTPTLPGGRTRQSVWTSGSDLSAIPVSAVAFKTSQTAFSRAVRLAASDGADQWTLVASGNIQAPAPGANAKLTLDDFSERYSRRWRITVDNVNDAPIPDLTPTLLTVPRHVVFRPAPGHSYQLLFGHPRAVSPGYDLAKSTDARMLEQAVPAALGAETENAAWVDPTPWTERYDAVLWVAMAIAAMALGLAAVRTLRAPGAVETV
jgi:Protein of unknown function (DUF3999)